MLQMQSVINCADNSGAVLLRCISVLGNSRRKYAYVGDIVTVSVISIASRKAVSNLKVQKGQVYKAVIVRTKSTFCREDGSMVSAGSNAAVLVNKRKRHPQSDKCDYELYGTRVFGPVFRETKRLRGDFMRILSLAVEVV